MPFGFWVLGNIRYEQEAEEVKFLSQMPFGFWVLGNATASGAVASTLPLSLKCLSAFGFWGTRRQQGNPEVLRESQMPFGFWVLGN